MAGLKRNVAGALLGALLASCSGGRDEAGDGNWTLYGLDSAEQRFSHLEQITPETVGRLGLAWSMDLPAQARSLQGTPLAIDGVLYFSTSPSKVYAVEAATGKQLWEYDPQAGIQHPRVLRTSHQGSRGIGYYKGAILLASLDGRLISIDCKTGKPRWIVNTIEEADSRKVITGAPRVFAGKVIVGNSGADFGTRGYVTTYDAETGRKLWRFYTVPGDPAKGFEDKAQEMAAKTWTGEWWRWGGGGTVWNGITYDKELNRIYIGVGNSSNYNPAQRSPGGGDNLFLASIVALDADTGKYVWHYQENPREAWDWKATNEMILTQMDIGGEKAAGADAGGDQRLLLYPRPARRKAAVGQQICQGDLGGPHRPQDRPSGRDQERPLRRWSGDDVSLAARGAQLAGDVLQSGAWPGVYPDPEAARHLLDYAGKRPRKRRASCWASSTMNSRSDRGSAWPRSSRMTAPAACSPGIRRPARRAGR
ncbi:PQQ-binding-like beta-propeller repeat protein [Novosphingobium colocasiae]